MLPKGRWRLGPDRLLSSEGSSGHREDLGWWEESLPLRRHPSSHSLFAVAVDVARQGFKGAEMQETLKKKT